MLAYGRIPGPDTVLVRRPIRDLSEGTEEVLPKETNVCGRLRSSIERARKPLLKARMALTKRLASADLPGEARLYLENALDALNKAQGRLEGALAHLEEAEERLAHRH